MAEYSIFLHPLFRSKSISLDDLASFDLPVAALDFNSEFDLKRDGEKERFLFNDQEHPITYVDDEVIFHKVLSIDKNYYEQNKDRIKKYLCNILANTNVEYFTLGKEFIEEDYLRALGSNPHIKSLRLGSNRDYVLTKEVHDILKDTSIERIITEDVVPELKEVFNAKIYCNDSKNLIGFETYQTLSKREKISIEKPLTKEQIGYFKYLKADCAVTFKNLNDFASILKAINVLRNNGNKEKITIRVQYEGEYSFKNEFNAFVAEHPEMLEKDIDVVVGKDEHYRLTDYMEYEKRLYKLIEGAYNLSPFEKYLYAYNVVKKYKEYKENEDFKDEARSLYEILDSEYMVCIGFSNMLGDFLDKLGIESVGYGVSVDVGFDDVASDAEIIPDDVSVKAGGHRRRIVRIVDPKYDIDGIYFADPTWDNVMDADTYNYALLTQEEYLGTKRYNYYSSNVSEMLFCNSLDEFYYKANLWMNEELQSRRNSSQRSLESVGKDIRTRFINYVEALKNVDEEEYDNIKLLFRNLFTMRLKASNIKDFIRREKRYLEKSNDDDLKDLFSSLESRYKYSYDGNFYSTAGKTVQKDFIIKVIELFKCIDKQKYEYFKKRFNDVYEYDFIPDDYYMSS